MRTVLLILQMLVSVGLIAAILMQNSKGGLGTAFGGGGEFRSKRGAEKILFRITIVLSALFLILSVVTLIVH